MIKIKKIFDKYWNWMLLFFLLLFLLLVVLIIINILDNDILVIDNYIYSLIIRYSSLTTGLKFITFLGSATFLITLSIMLLSVFKNKIKGLCIVINLALVTIISQLLKLIIQRPRPLDINLINETGFSFPSGHAMVSTAFYGFLLYLAYKYIKTIKLRNITCILLAIITIGICFSRIYLGVHYFSDVIGGILLAIIYLIFFVYLTKNYIDKNEK